MEPLVWPVQNFLALDARRYGFVDVIRHLQPVDALGKPRPGVLRGLQQARNHGRLEDPEEPRLLVPLDVFLLSRLQPGPQNALPFGVLDLEGV
jgi:hypothetical protein